jgi:hypothetical protein
MKKFGTSKVSTDPDLIDVMKTEKTPQIVSPSLLLANNANNAHMSSSSIKTIFFRSEDISFDVKFSDLSDGSGVKVSIPGKVCEVKWGSTFPDHFVDSLQHFMTDDDITKIEGLVLDRSFKGPMEVTSA